MRTAAVLALYLFLGTSAVLAQQAEPFERSQPRRGRVIARTIGTEVKRYGTDVADLARAPLQWNVAMWKQVGAIAAIDAAAFAADPDIARAVQRNRSKTGDDLSTFFTPFGGRRALNLSAAVLLTGVFRKNTTLRDSGRDAIEASILAAGIITPLIKRAVGRSRPVAGDGAYAFDPFSKNQSFPSGHATNAFAVASVFAAHSKGWIVPTIAYTLASGVAVARVNDDVHYTSDVIAGAAIGTAVGRSIVARRRRGAAFASEPSATWTIVPMRRGAALEIAVPLSTVRVMRKRVAEHF